MKSKRMSFVLPLLLVYGIGIGSGCGDERTEAEKAAKKADEAVKEAREAAAKAAAEAPPVILAAGTPIQGTLQNALSTEGSKVGQSVTLRVTEAVRAGDRVAVPAGSLVHGDVTHVRSAGRFKGAAELTVRFRTLELAGMQHPAAFEPIRWRIKGDGKETAAEISGGAAVGGIIGGVLGGADGALKGGAIGGAVGTGVAAVTEGKQIHVPAGQGLLLRLSAPVSLGGLPG